MNPFAALFAAWFESIDWDSKTASNTVTGLFTLGAVLVTWALNTHSANRKLEVERSDKQVELSQLRLDRRLEVDREEKRHEAEISRLTTESERQREHQKDLIEQQRRSNDKQETVALLYQYELKAYEVERLYTKHSWIKHEHTQLVTESRELEARKNNLNRQNQLEQQMREVNKEIRNARQELRDLADQITTRERGFYGAISGFNNFTLEYADDPYRHEEDVEALSSERQSYISAFHRKLEEYKKAPIE